MNKDLIDDKYGRFYEIPCELVRRGHEVTGLCLSYRTRNEGHVHGKGIDDCLVAWHSVNLSKTLLPGLIRYRKRQSLLCDQFKPDVIIGCSDALQIIFASKLSKKYNIPFIADLYDNFESYGLTKFPGILPLFKKAVKEANGVVTVSRPLQSYIEKEYSPKGQIKTIVNGTDTDLFRPMDKIVCRDSLGLPRDKIIIGTAGALDPSRGIDCLFDAFDNLTKQDLDIHLALVGVVGDGILIPERKDVHYLGEMDYETIPVFLNSLDVGVICNRDSIFGRYCFPQKAYEMIACGIQIVAADVGSMSEELSDCNHCLYLPDDPLSMAKMISAQIYQSNSIRKRALSWSELTEEVDSFIKEVT